MGCRILYKNTYLEFPLHTFLAPLELYDVPHRRLMLIIYLFSVLLAQLGGTLRNFIVSLMVLYKRYLFINAPNPKS